LNLRIVSYVIGRPGSGKDTQGSRLANCPGVDAVFLDAGSIFRSLARKADPEFKKNKNKMDGGDLLPDSYVNKVMGERISACRNRPIFLSGYPRTISQLEEFEFAFQAGVGFFFDTNKEECVRRIILRAATSGRKEDSSEEVIRHRMSQYDQATMPVLKALGASGRLVRINGMGEEDEVARRFALAFGSEFPRYREAVTASLGALILQI
jgi:adenylate kinase